MIINYKNHSPSVHETAFIAENASIIGRVTIGADSGIWFGTVLRGDGNSITVGERTNIQDNTVVHIEKNFETIIGNDVTIGHGAIIHACTIKDNSLVGMGAIVLNGAVIEENVIIGAGALIPPNKVIPRNSLVVGSPGKVVRELTEEEISSITDSAKHYAVLAKDYK